MAKICELAESWQEWVDSRPPVVKALCEKYPPNILFRLKDTGQRVYVISYQESGTVRVAITGEYNLINFSREVFGINPADLAECELPLPGEPLGQTQTEEETAMFFEVCRMAREQGLKPEDLFEKKKLS